MTDSDTGEMDGWIRSHAEPGPFADYHQAVEALPDVRCPTFGLHPGEMPGAEPRPAYRGWRTPLRPDQFPGGRPDGDDWMRDALGEALAHQRGVKGGWR